MLRSLSLLVIPGLFALGCAAGSGAQIQPIPPVEATVGVPLTVNVTVSGGSPSMVLGLDSDTRAIASGTGAGGQIVWTPLASEVGPHELAVLLLDGGNEIDREILVVTVNPSADSAPIFVTPAGAGQTFDLTRDAVVRFDVLVRDEDTPTVTLSAASLPEGARFDQIGAKEGELTWEPTPDQIEASERWTIALLADDGEHTPTEKQFIVVLRSEGGRDGCPGVAPAIVIDEPADGSRRSNEPGYSVVVTISDDMGLRDAPLLYYSTTEPDDPTKPDITEFEQVPFSAEGSQFRARVPSLGLATGAEQQIWYVVSATDNDDSAGTLCDHRTDSELYSFIAVGGEAAGLIRCSRCTRSSDCASGVCATDAGGARCLDTCSGGSCGSGTCSGYTTAEGGTASACGTVGTVCLGRTGTCTDDSYEPNDTLSSAATAPDTLSGQVCSGDDDFYRITASSGTDVTVTVDGFIHGDGDLDLQLLGSGGTILASSAGVTNSETVRYCVGGAGSVTARVFGYLGAENAYSMRVSRTAGSCCTDDALENDDTRATARSLSGISFDGTICPRDDDYVRFTVSSPTGVEITLVFDHATGDLDIELYGPSGTLVGASRGVSDTETISMDLLETGTYTVRVLGYAGDFGDYLGEVSFTTFSGCTSSAGCPSGEVCSSGSCRSGSCTSSSACPAGHVCPSPGPGGGSSTCGESCAVNGDCKASEACKWFEEGRYCGARGSGLDGAACSTFATCGGQRACLDWPGGYCARAGCVRNADCETGTYCVDVGGLGVCALDCWAADEICRLSAGYDCNVDTDLDGLVQFVCTP
jgi:hypothetical protein